MRHWGMLQWTLASALLLVAIVGALLASGVVSVRIDYPAKPGAVAQ